MPVLYLFRSLKKHSLEHPGSRSLSFSSRNRKGRLAEVIYPQSASVRALKVLFKRLKSYHIQKNDRIATVFRKRFTIGKGFIQMTPVSCGERRTAR